MPLNTLEAIKKTGIIIASDTGEYLKIPGFHPQDATTNPSLVLAAVTKPEYAHIVEEAIQSALSRHTSIDSQIEFAMDYLLVQVGIQILKLISGRVSVSVDPRLAYDHDAIVRKGRNLIAIFEELGFSRERILIKIPATYPGILAARTLENSVPLVGETTASPIHTNATLVFGLVQALACGRAGISVISPFIGRVKDWWTANEVKLGNGNPSPTRHISHHPGILLVQNVRSAFAAYGYTTQIMAAGFRSVEEVLELAKNGARGGPDLITLPPSLLDGLREISAVIETYASPIEVELIRPSYIPSQGPSMLEDETKYAEDLKKEQIALEKVPEGLMKFSADARLLEDLIRDKIKNRIESSRKTK